MKLARSLLLLGLLGAPALSHAGEVETAEHRRISEEMQRLAGRNAWQGVERNFQELLALEKEGEQLTYDEWYLGAQAARSLGDITACRERLAAAVKVEGKDEAIAWLEQIDTTFGAVSLRTVDKEAQATLSIAVMPFVPDLRSAVERAQGQVAESHGYEGLLPAGDYTFTSGDVSQSFTVTAGGEVVEVRLTPTSQGGSAIAYVGPRIDLGGSFLRGGAPVLDPALQVKDGGMPGAFGGAGARLGVGLEIGLKRGFGFYAQVGYHNLFSEGVEAGALRDEAVPQFAHLGFGTVGLVYRLGDLWLGLGGVSSLGVARVVGIADEAAIATICPEGTEDADCSWVADVSLEDRSNYVWAGSIQSSGFQGSVSYSLFDLGKSLEGGLELSGGLLFDAHRNYPWGQVAVVVGPAKKSRSE